MAPQYSQRSVETGCAPRDGSELWLEDELLGLYGAYWLRACRDDADCGGRAGYGCDLVIRACLPRDPVWLEIAGDFQVEPLCLDLDADDDPYFEDSFPE